MKKGLLGYYNYTVVLTYFGMLAAFAGILKIAERDFSTAIVCLMISGVCDMFDGKVASTKERDAREKRFGIQIDSLSDLISFGVFPAFFVYMFLDGTIFAAAVSSLYLLAALIRLAYFNVLEEERQQKTSECRKAYLGLPVTSIALLLPAVHLIYDCGVYRNRFMYPMLLILVMTAFLSPFEVKKPTVIGKIGMILVGALEVLAILFLMGWDAV